VCVSGNGGADWACGEGEGGALRRVPGPVLSQAAPLDGHATGGTVVELRGAGFSTFAEGGGGSGNSSSSSSTYAPSLHCSFGGEVVPAVVASDGAASCAAPRSSLLGAVPFSVGWGARFVPAAAVLVPLLNAVCRSRFPLPAASV
jgi:hypothetical protein